MPQQLPPGYRDAQTVFEEMRRYNQSLLSIALSPSFRTQQIALSTSVAIKIIAPFRPQVYMLINADPTNAFFIGDKNVTVTSGFPILAQNPMTFGVAENVEIWAIGNTANMVAYLLDLGF